MATILKAVLGYDLWLDTHSNAADAMAVLQCADGWKITVLFMKTPFDTNSLDLSGKQLFAHVPLTAYERYVDLLRNEKPVFAVIYTDPPNKLTLHCGNEPVGEEEAKPAG